MGHRTVKRVPLDFRWPYDKLWRGYVNRWADRVVRECRHCHGTGYNEKTHRLELDYYDHDGFGHTRQWVDDITLDEIEALARKLRFSHVTHDWVEGHGLVPKRWETKGWWCQYCGESVPQLSSEHHTGLCSCGGYERKMLLLDGDDIRLHMPSIDQAVRRRGPMGFDGIDRLIRIEARAKRLGFWGRCKRCRGKGEKINRRRKHAVKKYFRWRSFDPPKGSGWQLWQTTSKGSPCS
ncbi:MAG: hypothetical protein Q7S02_00695, partial [bacterium]|nr:hypothetical protein [bacterium]